MEAKYITFDIRGTLIKVNVDNIKEGLLLAMVENCKSNNVPHHLEHGLRC